jgi:pro-kumamolisin-like protein/PKD domain-containing protein
MRFGSRMPNRSLRHTLFLVAVVSAMLAAWVTPSGLPTMSGAGSSAVGVPFALPGLGFPNGPTSSAVDLEVAPAFAPSAGVAAVGPLPPSSSLTVEVGLALPNPSSLAALVASMYSPGTPEYHAFRTPAELARNFAAPMSTISAASSYFEGFGLAVAPSPDHLLLSVTGPSSHVAAAFGTTFEEYRSADGQSFVSHPTPARLPALAPWSGAYGLGNATPIVPAAEGPASAPSGAISAAACTGSFGGMTPCLMWQAYNMTSLITGGTNGSGTRLAVVDAYSSGEPETQLSADLASFDAENGLPPGSVNFVYPDADPTTLNTSANTGWNLEDALDLEWARASAPGAAIDMTFSPNSGAGLYEAVDWLVAHQAVNVISMSWGEPDVGIFNSYDTPCSAACNASTDGSYGIFSPVLAFAAAEGISVVAASGDCGAADGTSGLATNFPASDTDVTGVGGTGLSTDANGTYVSEGGWSGNETGARAPGCANQGGSGGGYAPFPRPWWQAGFVNGSTHRGVPDVALDAATPAEIVLEGSEAAVGGTSLSTPIWAGIAAIGDQYAGGPLGFLDPSLYAIAAGPNYSRDFHDIETGNNGYAAGPGWDPVTGLGTPRVASLLKDLNRAVTVTANDPTSFVYATPRFGEAPLTVTFHVNTTGGTSDYPLEGVSFGDGNASFASGGTATYTYGVPGVYSAQAYVADSSANYSVSPPVAIVVGGGSGLSVSLSASGQSPAPDAPVLFSTTVHGGTSPYLYNFSFGDGTFLFGSSSANVTHAFGAVGSYCASVVVEDSASPPDGGASSRVAVGVGGAPRPDCENDSSSLSMTATPNVGVRDAPADFPDLFSVSGGSTATGTLPPSIQYSSVDRYLSACNCAIFRSPGDYAVTGYGNDSENEGTTATTNVTVAPALLANFTAGRTFGRAPLTVSFLASASGGYGTDVARTLWSSGEETSSVGANATFTYDTPGWFVAVGHLSDLGHGNASEAFLIDVLPSTGSAASALTATVLPAVDIPFGTTVNFSAHAYAVNGSEVPSAFRWTLAPDSGAYQPAFNWTLSSPFPGNGNRTLLVSLTSTDLATGAPIGTDFALGNFSVLETGGFTPRSNALDFADSGGPEEGTTPFAWFGNASATAPGTFGIVWYFGDGSFAASSQVQYFFNPGTFTVLVTVEDSWGDVGYDVHPVAVRGLLSLNASISATQGAAPFTITFSANASGGLGPPYQYNWAFGDNMTADTANGTHTYENAGQYEVFLSALDYGRDTILRTWSVTVLAPPAPTTFPAWVLLVVGAGSGAALAVIVGRRRYPGGTASP